MLLSLCYQISLLGNHPKKWKWNGKSNVVFLIEDLYSIVSDMHLKDDSSPHSANFGIVYRGYQLACLSILSRPGDAIINLTVRVKYGICFLVLFIYIYALIFPSIYTDLSFNLSLIFPSINTDLPCNKYWSSLQSRSDLPSNPSVIFPSISYWSSLKSLTDLPFNLSLIFPLISHLSYLQSLTDLPFNLSLIFPSISHWSSLALISYWSSLQYSFSQI